TAACTWCIMFRICVGLRPSAIAISTWGMSAPHREGVGHGLLARVDPDALEPGVLLDRLGAVFDAGTAGLEALPRRHRRHGPVGVDPHGSGLQPGRHPVGPGEVRGPDTGRESVLR